MSRLFALLILLGIWAAIYLPALGSLEIKGEEGRRILPAITMMETGNYLVPQVGSEPYFRKPPLVNWLVAGSFKMFGVRNEWAARLPSVICVLLVAVAFVTVARDSLGQNGSLVAAIAWLTNFGIIEKGRLIEIEAIYVSLTGLAFICWFSFWKERRSPWLTWVVPFFFLGFGILAKGPVHLVFFYAVVVSILYRRRELRALWQPAHLVGIMIMLAIFAAWAVPCLRVMHEADVAHTWSRQFSGRLAGTDFKFGSWLLNIPRGLAYFLPWALFFPLAGRVEFVDETERRTVRGLAWGIAFSFVAVSLLPGSLPRYTMPLLVPACFLLSMLVCAERLDLPLRLRLRNPSGLPPMLRLPLTIAAIVCIGIGIYAMAVIPQLAKRQKVKAIASQIDAAVPPGATIYAVDPDYQPFLFYLHARLVYVSDLAGLPADAGYVLVQPENERALEASAQWSPRRPHSLLRPTDYRDRTVNLFAIE